MKTHRLPQLVIFSSPKVHVFFFLSRRKPLRLPVLPTGFASDRKLPSLQSWNLTIGPVFQGPPFRFYFRFFFTGFVADDLLLQAAWYSCWALYSIRFDFFKTPNENSENSIERFPKERLAFSRILRLASCARMGDSLLRWKTGAWWDDGERMNRE